MIDERAKDLSFSNFVRARNRIPSPPIVEGKKFEINIPKKTNFRLSKNGILISAILKRICQRKEFVMILTMIKNQTAKTILNESN
jgi:hypothetical protein